MIATKTLQDARDIFFWVLKEAEGDSNAYPIALVDALIIQAQIDICVGNVTDLWTADRKKIEKTTLSFLNARKFYKTSKQTYLNDGIDETTTKILAVTDGYSDTGSLIINDEKIAYTGKDSTGFTWVSGITTTHKSWDAINQLYKLPDDYQSIDQLKVNGKRAKSIDQRQIGNISRDNYRLEANGQYQVDHSHSTQKIYSIIDWTHFMIFDSGVSEATIGLFYEKLPTTLSGTDVLMTIPDTHSMTTAPMLAVGQMLFYRGEENRAMKILSFAYANVMTMYDFYASVWNEDLFWQTLMSWKSALNI